MHKCDVCGRSFDSTQKLGGHKGSHSRGERYRRRRRGEIESRKCLRCGTETNNPKFCTTTCFYESIRISTVTMHDGHVLNITRDELAMYRQTQLTCEICGQEERRLHRGGTITRLCVDHDHNTGMFRGLLCADCNRKLGWFEKYREQVENYLGK